MLGAAARAESESTQADDIRRPPSGLQPGMPIVGALTVGFKLSPDGFSLIKELFAVVVCFTKSKGFSDHALRA